METAFQRMLRNQQQIGGNGGFAKQCFPIIGKGEFLAGERAGCLEVPVSGRGECGFQGDGSGDTVESLRQQIQWTQA